jgi:hypothetical protein
MMCWKLKLFLQIQNQAKDSNIIGALIFLGVIGIFGLIIWQLAVSKEFAAAKDEFRRNPSGRANRERLIKAAKSRNDEGLSALEVMSLLDKYPVRDEDSRERNSQFVVELKTIAELHSSGQLSDEEFEQAKAKLLK